MNSYLNSAFPYSTILDPSASDSSQEDPFLEVPFLEDPCPVDPFLVALVRRLLEDPFQAQDPCQAEGPLDPFLADHFAATKSSDQKEVCRMVGHCVVQVDRVVLVSFLAAVDLAFLVVDHALESSALLDLQDQDLQDLLVPVQVQVPAHGTLEVVLC